ncbi:MAG: hypothetical protein IK007_06490 [Lachnospiraceae bacterium]|nr:hypothetical protein [Lachnospiraceae bacterium]
MLEKSNINLIYDMAHEADQWEVFFTDYASNEHVYKADVKKLRTYIDEKKYLDVLGSYEQTGAFPVPQLKMLNKKGTEKKRVVFSFDEDASWLLKFFGYFLHAYDDIFSDNLYSFRKERSVKTAVARLLKKKNLSDMYGVKLDIHDYFNSADTEMIIAKLNETLTEQEILLKLFENILRNPNIKSVSNNIHDESIDEDVDDDDDTEYHDSNTDENTITKKVQQAVTEITSPVHKGMMAGSPLSPFLANLYLDDMDKYFEDNCYFYARYSDDIIFFTDSKENRQHLMDEALRIIEEHKLTLNPDKLSYIDPGHSFEFLGFSFNNDTVDVSATSFDKIKKKLRRKSRAVLRWKLKKAADPEKAAKVFIRYFNRKFFENPVKSELTWCRWYFPIITTDVSLREIDHYMQECIRFIYTGKHTKRNYNLRYEDIKKIGYRSLVNEFHKSS